MYISVYGFEAPATAWTTILSDYNSSYIASLNWMYSGLDEWTISRDAGYPEDTFLVFSTDGVNTAQVLKVIQ